MQIKLNDLGDASTYAKKVYFRLVFGQLIKKFIQNISFYVFGKCDEDSYECLSDIAKHFKKHPEQTKEKEQWDKLCKKIFPSGPEYKEKGKKKKTSVKELDNFLYKIIQDRNDIAHPEKIDSVLINEDKIRKINEDNKEIPCAQVLYYIIDFASVNLHERNTFKLITNTLDELLHEPGLSDLGFTLLQNSIK